MPDGAVARRFPGEHESQRNESFVCGPDADRLQRPVEWGRRRIAGALGQQAGDDVRF